jgi:Putative zinc-finger
MVRTTHVADDLLAGYAARRLSEGDELEVEMHLAECEACTALARSALLVGDIWESWSARAHGEAYLAERLARAVERAAKLTDNAGWQARLSAWAASWSGRAEATVRVIMETSGNASRVVTDGLEALSRPGTAWQFAAVPVAVPTRGPLAGGSAPPPTVALATGATQARVFVGEARREVVVRLDGQLAGGRPPLVLLVPVDEAAEPRLAVIEPRPGVAYMLARFSDVPAGDYVVAFEPLG